VNTGITELIDMNIYYTVMAEKVTKHKADSIRRNMAPMMKFQQSSKACMYLHTVV
jgi:hypothetical protein